MTPSGHNQMLTKDWGKSKKHCARNATVVEPYRLKYSNHIPDGMQYWSTCGRCADDNGNIVKWCEFNHVTRTGLIQKSQFYGVEIMPEVHEYNKKISSGNWYLGDIHQIMVNHKAEGNFKPAIVNFDSIHYADKVAAKFGAIMRLLSGLDHSVMLIGNFVMQSWIHEQKHPDFNIEELNKTPSVVAALAEADWSFNQLCYEYAGSDNKSRSIMGSIILHKKEIV